MVMGSWLFVFTFAATLGSAVMAGLFFVFSNTIMTAFGKLPPAAGMAAMQAINVWIVNPRFLAAFLGTPAVSVVLVPIALFSLAEAWSLPLLAGSMCYLVGSLVVTMAFNVPLNNRLAAANPNAAEGASLWADYLRVWTAWNHLRSVLSLAPPPCSSLPSVGHSFELSAPAAD